MFPQLAVANGLPLAVRVRVVLNGTGRLSLPARPQLLLRNRDGVVPVTWRKRRLKWA